MPPRLQRLHHSSKHTPLLAAQANGRVNFLRLFYPSLYDWQSSSVNVPGKASVPSSLNPFESSYLSDDYWGDFYFNFDHFEKASA